MPARADWCSTPSAASSSALAALRSRLRIESRRVVFLDGVGDPLSSVEVLPADEASSWGLRPFVVIADELSVWPTGAKGLWASVVSSLLKVPLVAAWSCCPVPATRATGRPASSTTPAPRRSGRCSRPGGRCPGSAPSSWASSAPC